MSCGGTSTRRRARSGATAPTISAVFALSNFAGALLLSPLFDSLGRVRMITGTYVLSGPAAAGRPITLRAVYRTGMAHDALFFVVDARRPRGDTAACGAATATSGVARILDATRNNYPEDTGRWTVTGTTREHQACRGDQGGDPTHARSLHRH